jgi:ribonuclease G
MAKEICISSTPHETRLAILEDDQLAEIYYERENEYTLAGSIYNGRVTRVLPGMQSAFVDIGLERDAFLYVTDFLELEDQEETDELERAAASSPNQPPREVRHSGDRNGQRHERQAKYQRPAAEFAPETTETTFEAAEPNAAVSEQLADAPESGEPGAKRWRGRRRRRGGRGAGADSQAAPSETEESVEPIPAAAPEPELPDSHEIHAAALPLPRADRTPTPFVLPGESLSKYGGAPEESKSEVESAPPARPVVTSRPSTLIEAPIEWDGSGLLPGESISRHRKYQVEPPAEVDAEPQGTFADAFEAHIESEAVEDESLTRTQVHTVEPPADELTHDLAPQTSVALPVDEGFVEQSLVQEGLLKEEAAPEPPVPDSSIVDAEPVEPEHQSNLAEPETASEHAGNEPEDDAAASHHIDPAPPTGFRLFGLGGKKKKSEETPEPTYVAEEPKPATSEVSVFSPGSGLVEEEVIEGEEFDSPLHRHHKPEDHDLDDYEEETIQTQIRSGELGEMLQEAHLDHRIQLNFDDKGVEEEEEEGFEGEEEEEEHVSAEGQPAGEGQVQQRRERGGRGRRGRGGHRPGDRRGPTRRSAQTSNLPIISDLLKPGQEILVQIAKEPIAKKGARITSHIALPGRFLVFMPTVSHIGVSRKISSDEERQRLKRILLHERGEASGGFIVRTAAEGASEEELRADLRFLIHLWNEIKQRSDSSKSPALIYHDLSLIERILRDQVSANFSSIWVDSETDYERIVRFLNRFSPTLVRRVKLYTKETPLFEHFGIQDEISKALRSKVWLKSGGSIVINQTEALVAIDINTGKYVGKTARLEDTIVKTNLDAIPEIVRQIRLRDLGGIIIIDFIDMDERKNRFKVMAALEEALKNDRAPTKVLQFNDFGLVAITRKRVKQSLERTLSVPCPICQATGMVKSPATVCNEIFIELRKMRRHFESSDVLLRVNPETVKALKANNARWLTDFEELTGKNILVKSDPTLHPEQFDIQG